MTSPFPEPESPELERFRVYARVEIVALLARLRDQRVQMTAYFDDAPGFALTLPLSVDEEEDAVVFDALADAEARARLLASRRIVFVGFLDHVKVQFSADTATSCDFEDGPAFQVPLPESLLRLQRRDFFRVAPPSSRPATCLVPYGEDGKQYEKLRVLDLSVGGTALLTYPEKFELPTGQVIENCTLDLPGVGSVAASVIVRQVSAVKRDDNARRAGCEFIDMAPQARMLLQRYVNRIEAELRKAKGPVTGDR